MAVSFNVAYSLMFVRTLPLFQQVQNYRSVSFPLQMGYNQKSPITYHLEEDRRLTTASVAVGVRALLGISQRRHRPTKMYGLWFGRKIRRHLVQR